MHSRTLTNETDRALNQSNDHSGSSSSVETKPVTTSSTKSSSLSHIYPINTDGVKPAIEEKRSPLNYTFYTLPPDPINIPQDVPTCFPLTASSLHNYDLIVALDSEYVEREGANFVLSYQMSAIYFNNFPFNQFVETIILADGQRRNLGDLIGIILRAFKISRKAACGLKVLLVWHFGVAEWSCLKDRKKVSAEHLKVIHKVPVTIKPQKFKVNLGSKNYAEIKLTIFDTHLLAPAEVKSLKSLGQICVNKKMNLQEGEIEQMDELLKTDAKRFTEYAINDTRVTLEYLLRFAADYEQLTGIKSLPITLGSGAVKSYLKELELKAGSTGRDLVFGCERRQIVDRRGRLVKRRYQVNCRRFTETFAADCYMGGMSAAYYLGKYLCSGDQIILDLDFAGAYPTSLALLPMIDWQRGSDRIYHVADLTNLYERASTKSFVEIVLVNCRFRFPANTRYPCLPVQSPYGLLYPLEGETSCTGIEVMLALNMGADVQIVRAERFCPQIGTDGQPLLAFAGFLGNIALQRSREEKGSLKERLLKEMMNSFYGKLAQGIRDRTIYNFYETGDSVKKIPPSQITCPHYAAICTGITRASLCALINLFDSHSCEILSATTDGAMIVAPRLSQPSVDQNGIVKAPSIWNALSADLSHDLKAQFPLNLINQGRIVLGLEPDSWLVIKHLGDYANTIKTRGYKLKYLGVVQHEARAGLSRTSSDELEELSEATEVRSIDQSRLASFREIYEGKYPDLITVREERKVNLDWDFKRMMQADGKHTRAPQTVTEVYEHRDAAQRIRSQGKRATPLDVAVRHNKLQCRGGSDKAVRRYIHTAICKGLNGWRPTDVTDKQLAEALCVNVDYIKNCKRRKFRPQQLPSTEAITEIVLQEVKKLDTSSKILTAKCSERSSIKMRSRL